MEDLKYDFIYLPDKTTSFMQDKNVKNFLLKWSMDNNLKIQFYNFNQPYSNERHGDFIKSFFDSPVVYNSLQVCNYSKWSILCQPCDRFESKIIPCTVTSMSFFDRLLDPENGVVRSEKGDIIMKFEEKIGEFYSGDNLRACLLEEESDLYKLYSDCERKEFLFKLLQHFALGGVLCQFEDNLKPYLDTVKKFYKEMISVYQITDSEEIRIRSQVIKVVGYINDIAVCPSHPNNPQNFVYLIINSSKRQLAVVSHQYTD